MYTLQVWSDDSFEAASRWHRPVAVHRRGCARCILGDLHRIYEKVAMMDESLASTCLLKVSSRVSYLMVRSRMTHG